MIGYKIESKISQIGYCGVDNIKCGECGRVLHYGTKIIIIYRILSIMEPAIVVDVRHANKKLCDKYIARKRRELEYENRS